MDLDFAITNNLPIVASPRKHQVFLANGSHAGTITQQTASLRLQIGHHVEPICFLLTKLLATLPISLGIQWLQIHNPEINWRQLKVEFSDPICLSHRHLPSADGPASSARLQDLVLPPAGNPTVDPDKSMIMENASTFLDSVNKDSLDISLGHLRFAPDGSNPSLFIHSVVLTKEYTKSSLPLDSRGVPFKYMAYADVFTTKSEPPPGLPPHRQYDLSIEFNTDADGKPLPLPKPGKIYPLSPSEESALSEYIKNALARGWITHSTSPLGAPCFYVPKPNGGLRLCIDYRGLNAITKRNRYPLPLGSDLLDKLASARFFTHLDLPDAYHLLRIKSGDEWKTAFRTKFGSFQYQVVSFGLTNAPSAFQYFLNDVFSDYLGNFVIIYLDDILIYSTDEATHEQHVKLVLDRLCSHHLQLRPEKCTFHVQETDFLGFIISSKGISMNPEKISAVSKWPTPKSRRDIQVFLGFCNFYRRFILGFSELAKPLTRLTSKSVPFEWSPDCESSFLAIKESFSTEIILSYFNFSKAAIVETDASDFAIAAVLSQYDDEGILHPVSFFSRQLLPAEINYDTTDKELLAVVDAFATWRHYLVCSPPDFPTLVLSDHKNLEPFTTVKQLSRRQFRWYQSLSSFNFRILHRPGRLNGKADALSRRPDYELSTALQSTNFIQIFEKLSLNAISVVSSSPDFLQRIQDSLASSDLLSLFHKNLLPPGTTFSDKLLYYQDLIWLPTEELQLEVFHSHHSSPVAGHFGLAKTVELISRNYYWPKLRKTIARFLRNCDVCLRAKPDRSAPYGLLQPLPVPSERWLDLSMDFMTDLPPSNGFDTLLVIKDRLSKQAHFIACHNSLTAPQLAEVFIKEIFRLHGSPRSIVSDRDKLFTSSFWTRFSELIGSKSLLSTAFHPQTDGSTEVLNQVIEQYLRIFCNYQQDNWVSLLPLAEFTYNNSVNSSTGMSPFFANHGHHPLFDLSVIRNSTVPSAEERVKALQVINLDLQANLAHAQASYTVQANKHRSPGPSIAVNDLVFLNRRNLNTTRPSRKFDDKFLGPFRVSAQINPVTYKLDLPPSMKIHPVFHVSLLKARTKDLVPALHTSPPPQVIIQDQAAFEVESVLDSRIYRNQLQYLVKWLDYPPSDNTWEPATTLQEDIPDLLSAFHSLYPLKPGPTTSPGVRRKRRG